MATVQDIIEQAKEREALFKRAKKGVRKERLEKFRRIFQMPTRVAAPIRKRDIRLTAAARKAVSLVAPKGSLIKAITTPKKKGKRGRGRPRETYKVRVLPSGRVVKVPTHIYKKMLSQEKAQIRLIRAQRQAQAEQLAMETDQRFQPDMEDERFLTEPDQVHEMEVLRAQQLAEMAGMEAEVPSRPRVGRRIIRGVGDVGRGISRIGMVRPRPMVDEFGRPIEPRAFRPQIADMGLKGEPRVTAISDKSNLLRTPNQFNNTGQSSILWNNKGGLY